MLENDTVRCAKLGILDPYPGYVTENVLANGSLTLRVSKQPDHRTGIENLNLIERGFGL